MCDVAGRITKRAAGTFCSILTLPLPHLHHRAA